ncbi:hypothetical protein IPJ72_03275 [Candidatus Peregrinibacteria bacterium]|nr:MAG: hypothetical protein IPJ72_03275 [Candidatus Peregrinibacteria bacterium]
MNSLSSFDFSPLLELIQNSSLEFSHVIGFVLIYFSLLWLSIIIWVTRDAIQRSNSIIFQVIAILLTLLFPVLGVLIYLIIRPSKTSIERYYEDLERQMAMERAHHKSIEPAAEKEVTTVAKPSRAKVRSRSRKRSSSDSSPSTL